MPKSKYPQQLDTSIEIPPVRDNILEVGSEVLNSLRSAIFNIEKTLGINPQGAVGNSVAERLSKSLDANGNIKSEALSKANLLTGPIIDADVSKVAGIQEDKLRLDFPTRLLQSEISSLNSSIESIVSQIETLSLELSVHINKNSLNRHPATAITTDSYESTTSDFAVKNISSGNVQTALQDIYTSHINYSGVNISQENSSHTANQIFFDNSIVPLYISSENVQDAIEEVTLKAFNSEVLHQDIMHSNGILRNGYLYTSENTSYGNIIAENISVSFVASTELDLYTITINLNDSVDLTNFILEKSDIITLSSINDPNASYAGDYEILDYSKTGNILNSVTILGNIFVNSDSQTVAKISKRIRKDTNTASLLLSPREEVGVTSCKTLQVCNPNSVRVISSGINPLELSATKKYIGVSINGNTPYILDLLYSGSSQQTIDTVVSSINKQCAINAYNFLSYRLDQEGKPSELVIAYNIPDTGPEKYTITISRENDDGIDAAGFSTIEDIPVSSEYGSNYFILGKPYSDLGTKLDTKLFSFQAGTTLIDSATSGIDFISYGIKPYDLISITDAENSSDDKTFVITSVNNTYLSISSQQAPLGFAGGEAENTRFRIFKNIVSFDSITFDQVNASLGSSIYDIFINKNQDLFINKRFEYQTEVLGVESKINLIDFEGDVKDKQYSLDISVSVIDNHLTLTLDGGVSVDVYGENNSIWVQSGTDNSSLKFYIPDVLAFSLDTTMIFYGYEGVSNLTNLFLARIPYDNFTGRVSGGADSGISISKLSRGNIGSDDISSEAINTLIEIPRSELRGNGVVRGLEVSNPVNSGSLYSFDIQPGICYVRGKRLEIPGKSNFITNIDPTAYDKIFIGIDFNGNIYIEPSTPSCASPFEESSVCTLAAIEFSNPDLLLTDLRLFIDHLDLKVLNAITVSPHPGMGHFQDIGKAIRYAKKFSELYPRAGVPSIHLKSGKHYLTVEISIDDTYANWLATGTAQDKMQEIINGTYEKGLVIDFPVNIIGEGDSTEVFLRNKYIYTDITYIYRGSFSIIGKGYSGTTFASQISSGVISFSNFKMNNSKISLVDMVTSDGPDKYPFLINIDSVTFDTQDYEAPNPIEGLFPLTGIAIIEVYNTTEVKGNVNINNCNFIPEKTAAFGSAIIFSDATRIKNISITSNRLYNCTTGTSLLSVDLISQDSGSNITLLGNMALGNNATGDGNRAEIYDGAGKWYDKISRDLYAGGRVYSNSDFSYSTTKNFSQTYHLAKSPITYDMLNATSLSTIQTATLTTTSGTKTYYLSCIRVPPTSTISVLLDRVPVGGKISSFEVGLENISLNTTVRLKSINKYFPNADDLTTHYTATQSNTYYLADVALGTITYNSVNTTISDNRFYFITISHSELISNVDFFYVKLNFEINDISDALGLI